MAEPSEGSMYPDARYPVDVQGAQGLYIGDEGHQYNLFFTDPAGSTDAYELKMESRSEPASLGPDVPPSVLLAAHLVPFSGRSQELRKLAGWRNSAAQLAVLLVHGAGGQGKTRLAAQFGVESPGWRVVRARHVSELGRSRRTPGSERLPQSRRLLVVVDYADRWPLQDLIALVGDPRLRRENPVRLVLMARSGGLWWEVTRTRLARIGVPADDLPLAPIADPAERAAAFSTARDFFADYLRADGARAARPPDDLGSERWGHVLTLHMAALVAVDSYLRRQTPPGDPAALSGYLLGRELDHWQHMHDNGRIETPPSMMARVVFTAILTRPLSHDNAEAVLGDAGIAATQERASQILDDHARCYPPASLGTVLEPLFPDRLGEDYLGLTTPGHEGGYRADPGVAGWAATAPSRLFARLRPGDDPPAWSRAALVALVETARRWPHTAERLLYPLLRAQPGLTLAAGDTVLVALADLLSPGLVELPVSDLALLESLEALFPAGRDTNLDLGIEAVTRRLTAHRIATSSNPLRHAALEHELARRQVNAGLREKALASMTAAVVILRDLPEPKPARFDLTLSLALRDLGGCLAGVGQDSDALACQDEAVALLSRSAPDGAALARALSERSHTLGTLGRETEAAEAAYESLRILRRLNGADPEKYLPSLAQALTSYAYLVAPPISSLGPWKANLAKTGTEHMTRRERNLAHGMATPGHRRVTAGEAAEEAMGIYGRLAATNPDEFEPSYAASITTYAAMAWPQGERDVALDRLAQAVGMFREFARRSPDAFQPALARTLLILAQVRSTGRTEPADNYPNPFRLPGYGPVLMSFRDDMVTFPLMPATDQAELDAARDIADEAIMIYTGLAARFPSVFTSDLDMACEIRAEIGSWPPWIRRNPA